MNARALAYALVAEAAQQLAAGAELEHLVTSAEPGQADLAQVVKVELEQLSATLREAAGACSTTGSARLVV